MYWDPLTGIRIKQRLFQLHGERQAAYRCLPSVVSNLYDHGADPLQMQTLCMTHIHADHYMGLAPLLHHWHVGRRIEGMENVGRLTIVGSHLAQSHRAYISVCLSQ